MTRIIEAQEIEKHFNAIEFPQENNKDWNINCEQVILRFPQTMAYRIYDEFEVDEIHKKDDGDYIISSQMPIDQWLIGYLLSFGYDVSIIEPVYLKNIICDVAKKICEQNKP